MSLASTLRFVAGHPLSRANPAAAVWRFGAWQLRSRFSRDIAVPWIDGSSLVARRGMTGATGNVYCGLHEFPEMAFLLHLLRPGDLFIDVGANIGSYSVLAAKVCGARAIAVEPDPDARAALARNLTANGIGAQVEVQAVAMGDREGEVAFTIGLDTVNRVAQDASLPQRRVPMKRLDDICAGRSPVLIKLDVEGFEAQVLAGAARVLTNPALLAVQSELDDPSVSAALKAAGFSPKFYDPLSRTLSDTPLGYKVSNTIFVRPDPKLEERLKSASRRRIHGVEF